MGGGTTGGTRGQVMDIAVADNGDVYIGGWFNAVKSDAENSVANTAYVAKWSAGAWSSLGTGGVTANLYGVCAVELDDPANPSKLFVGGDFTSIGTATSDNMAVWNTGASTWSNAAGFGTRSQESCPEEILAVGPDEVYVASSNELSPALSYFAKYTPSSGAVASVDNGFADKVFGLAAYNGDLYATGNFSQAGASTTAKGVAKASTNNPSWAGLGANPTTSGIPECTGLLQTKYCTEIAVDSGGRVYVGGNFTKTQNDGVDVARSAYISMWDPADGLWKSLGSISGTNVVVEEVNVIGNYVYIGGRFTCINDFRMNNIARYNINTSEWEAVGDGTLVGLEVVTNGAVRSIEPTPDGNSLYIGGSFLNAGNNPNADNIAKLTHAPTQAGPCNPVASEISWLEAPTDFETLTGGSMTGKNPNYNGGESGRLLDFVWKAPAGVNYYAYKVSAEWVDPRNEANRQALPEFDCWTSGLSCEVIVPTSYDRQGWRFSLRGFQLNGHSKPATWKLPSPFDPVFPAGVPTDVKAVGGWNTITVNWKAPSFRGTYPITNYLVTSVQGGRTCITTLRDENMLQCVFTSLTPGTNYTFKVQALNGAGWGDFSVLSNSTTPYNLKITGFSRRIAKFLFFQLGSDVEVSGVAPGYAPGAEVTAWFKIGESDWTKGPVLKVDQSGKVNLKQRLPRQDNGSPLVVRFQDAGGNYSNNVIIPRV